jgi:hypothetical protein
MPLRNQKITTVMLGRSNYAYRVRERSTYAALSYAVRPGEYITIRQSGGDTWMFRVVRVQHLAAARAC